MKSKKNGYSILEAVIAMGILLLAIVPVMTIATQSITFNHRSSEGEEAVRISEMMVDYIKSRGYDNVSSNSGKRYKIIRATDESSFTVEEFGDDFGIDNDLILLNSKGLGLLDTSIYLIIEKKNDMAKIKKWDNTNEDKFQNFVTGKTTENAYGENLIYGKLLVGYGDDDITTLTGKSKETTNEFVMTPIENWK